jgi:hypothetical protein
MVSTLNPTQFEFPADLPDPVLAMSYPADVKRPRRPSLGKRVLRSLSRFLIVFCIGVAATLIWQSYGDAARAMIANSSPQLGWLAPQTASVARTAPDTIATPALAIPSAELEQLKAMLLGFAMVQQRVDELAASQQQMAGDIANVRADQQELHQKLSTPPPRPTATTPRKPEPLPATAQTR